MIRLGHTLFRVKKTNKKNILADKTKCTYLGHCSVSYKSWNKKLCLLPIWPTSLEVSDTINVPETKPCLSYDNFLLEFEKHFHSLLCLQQTADCHVKLPFSQLGENKIHLQIMSAWWAQSHTNYKSDFRQP